MGVTSHLCLNITFLITITIIYICQQIKETKIRIYIFGAAQNVSALILYESKDKNVPIQKTF